MRRDIWTSQHDPIKQVINAPEIICHVNNQFNLVIHWFYPHVWKMVSNRFDVYFVMSSDLLLQFINWFDLWMRCLSQLFFPCECLQAHAAIPLCVLYLLPPDSFHYGIAVKASGSLWDLFFDRFTDSFDTICCDAFHRRRYASDHWTD